MVIEVSHAGKSFGDQKVLEDITLTVPAGQRMIILGQNGAGKTTLLRCLLGHYRLDTGEVRIAGVNPAHEFASKTSGLLVQDAIDYCHRFGLRVQDHWNKPFNKLSGGMKQKVLASLAFARNSPIMFFDEPTANLDAEGRVTFGNIIRDERFSQTTMIFISHRIEELNTLLNRAVWLDLGRIVKDEKL